MTIHRNQEIRIFPGLFEGEYCVTISIDRDGVCMGDDAMNHRMDVTLDDNATARDLLDKLLEMNYLPDLTDAVWYTWSLEAPCIIAWSCKKKKIIAELRSVPLEKDSTKVTYDFCHLWREDLHILKKCIKETPGIWYDKDFFGGRL